MNHGELIRKLRTDRKISQKTLCDNIQSQSTMQRIEQGKSKIDVDTLWLYLEKLNIRPDEYFQEYHNFQLSKKDYFRQHFRNALENRSHAHEYLNLLKSEYSKEKDIFYLYMIIQTKAVGEQLPGYNLGKVDSEEISIIYDYLEHIDSWGYFELAIYTNCLGFFKSRYRIFNYQDVISQFRKFNGSMKYQHALINFLVNSLFLLFTEKDYDNCLPILSTLYDETIDSDFIKGRLYWRFFNRLYQSIKNDFEFDGAVSIEMFNMLGYKKEAENLKDIEKSVLNQI